MKPRPKAAGSPRKQGRESRAVAKNEIHNEDRSYAKHPVSTETLCNTV